MMDDSVSREELLAELHRIRQRVTELESWKTQHEWVLDVATQCEDQFRSLAENLVVGVYLIQDGRLKYANPKLAEIVGYSVEELLALSNFMSLIFPDDRPLVLDNIEKRLSGEVPSSNYQARVVRKDGEVVWLEVYGSRMQHNGAPAVMGTVLDITGRMRAEVLLEKELDKFHALYDLAVAMTADRDLDENLTLVVEKSRELLGSDTAYIGLRDEEAGHVYMHILSGVRTEEFKAMKLPFGTGVGETVATTQEGFIVRNYFREFESSPVQDIVKGEGLISGIAVPIQIGQTNLGVLYVFNRTETSFSKSDLDTLFLLGSLAAVEIIRRRQEINLRKAHNDLEQKVQERTRELFDANEQLKQEIVVREKAEDSLRQNESMLKDILSTSPVGIGLTEDRIIRWSNEAWMKMFGYENELEFVGKNAAIVYPSHEEYERVGNILYERLKTGRVTSAEATFKRKDGSLFKGHIRMKALCPPDVDKGAIAVISDISERKRAEEALRESEERYRAIFNNASVGIALTDPSGRWVQVNPVFCKMLGRTWEELQGLTNLDITDPEDIEASRERFHSLIHGHIDSYRYQKRFVRKNGNAFWTDVSVSAIRDPEGRCLGTVGVVVDITESKEAQRALQDSQQRLELALEGADLGLWDWNMVTREVVHNQRWAKMMGMSANNTKSNFLVWKQKIHPEDKRHVLEALNSHLAGSKPYYESEYRLQDSKGVWAWVHARGKVVERDESGKPLRMTGTSLDITNRKRAEQVLQESENKFRLLYENAPLGYQSLDEHGYLVEVNKAWLDLLGYSREEVIGTWFGNYLATGLNERFREKFSRLKELGIARGSEFEMVKKDGTLKTVAIDGTFARDEHSVGRAHCVLIDVTGRRKAEKVQRRLATAVEQVNEGIVITDSDGVIQYVNPAFERMTDYSREEVLGRKTAELWSSSHSDEFTAELRSTLERGEVWSGRIVERKKDGTVYQDETTISPVFDDSGRIINFVGVKRDVTEQIALERKLLHAQKMEAVGTLAGGIAHDFNNLLTVVSGYTELLLTGRSHDDPEYPDLRKIAVAAQRGAELVRSLLAFGRKMEAKLRPVNLNHSVDQIRKLIYRTIPKMIEIKLDLADDLRIVNADPAQIEQVLINLAVNAKDAMPDGGKLIIETANVTLDAEYCKTYLVANPGDYVQITVSDTGHGVDKEALEHIFEPFYTTKKPGKGTGLGLAMAYGIVQQHEGHITCYSEQGEGTTFKIYIPAIEAEVVADVAATLETPAFGTETILLVDDEQFVRELGVRILNLGGYTVLTATNGQDALEVFANNMDKISLVILDLIMPGMGGSQCLQELLKLKPELKVIIASGFSLDGPAKETVHMGAKALVNKPYRANQILRLVRQILDAS
ncbi:MAG: PAS domain S-box protein [Desulfomonile tiedjei]|nr:PAS domain S-box protein [Desulfomonile tiedjei]